MKNLLKSLFFPGITYPVAIIWHLILGGFVVFLLVALVAWSVAAAATYTVGAVGPLLGLIAGFLVWRLARRDTLNDKASR